MKAVKGPTVMLLLLVLLLLLLALQPLLTALIYCTILDWKNSENCRQMSKHCYMRYIFLERWLVA